MKPIPILTAVLTAVSAAPAAIDFKDLPDWQTLPKYGANGCAPEGYDASMEYLCNHQTLLCCRTLVNGTEEAYEFSQALDCESAKVDKSITDIYGFCKVGLHPACCHGKIDLSKKTGSNCNYAAAIMASDV